MAVHDAVAVCLLQGLGDLVGDLNRAVETQLMVVRARDEHLDVPTRHVLADDVGL